MNGGSIINSTGGNTGGVALANSFVTFTMNGGNISNNSGTIGGVKIESGGTFIMNGGNITNNSGKNMGGVQIDKGTFIMNNGNITSNTASNQNSVGGFNINYGTFEIHGGTINNNSATINDSGYTLSNIVEWQTGNPITHDFTINPNFIVNTSPTSRYQIVSALDNNKALSIEQSNCNANNGECNIWIWSNNKDIGQKWMPAVESIVDGKVYYKIYHISDTNACLDVSNGQTVDGTKIQLYTCNGTPSQKWKFTQINN